VAAYPPIHDPPGPQSASPVPQPAPPVVHPATLVGVQEVNSAPELDGAEGYRFTIKMSATSTPKYNAVLYMVVGEGNAPPLTNTQITSAGNVSNGETVFTLTASQYHSLPTTVHVIVQYGNSPKPSEYSDCGTVNLP
jgi:hypothetical protein